MRRPLPPELVELGDHLETAARRTLARRPTRRQQFLNAFAAVAIALPMVPSVLGAMTPSRVAVTPAPAAVAPADRAVGGASDDFPPRALRSPGAPSQDVLAEPSTLRRALR